LKASTTEVEIAITDKKEKETFRKRVVLDETVADKKNRNKY
jgi:hypothetical protein